MDSNGPDVRIRGTANQIYDKYQTLARDAQSAGDRVKAENYLQHAEHYFRLIRSIQASQPQQQNQPQQNNNNHQPAVEEEQPAVEPAESASEKPEAPERKASASKSPQG